jgi:hypothetical protein
VRAHVHACVLSARACACVCAECVHVHACVLSARAFSCLCAECVRVGMFVCKYEWGG